MNLCRSRVDPAITAQAKVQRQHPTAAEEFLWKLLRKKQLGVRFKRQYVIGGYIVDFWCPRWRMVVEIDGQWHDPERDRKRDADLEMLGIRTLRFPDHTPPENIIADILADYRWLQSKKPPSPTLNPTEPKDKTA